MDRRRGILNAQNNKTVKPYDDYLTIVALEDGLTVNFAYNSSITNCYYRINDGNWTTLSSGVTTPSINTNSYISFKATWSTYGDANNGMGKFTISKNCNLEGNCTSLLYSDDAKASSQTRALPTYAFEKLFYNCSTIINISEDFLPSKSMGSLCYGEMFYGCSSLINAPKLPATTLNTYCYSGMFKNCTSLVSVPSVLPALTLKTECYYMMFSDCTSLTTAPEISATTITGAYSCCQNMFYNCSALTKAPTILPATTLETSCYYSMFYGCSSLTTAPILPAETLVDSCYSRMFYYCFELNYIKMLATNISATNCLTNWVSWVASTGTFVKNAKATWNVVGVNGVPTGWIIQGPFNWDSYLTITIDNGSGNIGFWYPDESEYRNDVEYNINGDGWEYMEGQIAVSGGDRIAFRLSAYPSEDEEYPGLGHFEFTSGISSISLSGNLWSMGYGDLASSTNECMPYQFCRMFENAPVYAVYGHPFQDATMAEGCCYEMFSGCSILNEISDLSCANIESYCFYGMFRNCSSLERAPELPQELTDLSPYCFAYMFYGCTSLESAPSFNSFERLSTGCFSHMFRGCVNLTTAPILQATELVNSCYNYMFYGCSKLNHIEAHFTTSPSTSYTYYWVYGVASTGTFVKSSDATWNVTGVNGVPTGWTISSNGGGGGGSDYSYYEVSTSDWVKATDNSKMNLISGYDCYYSNSNCDVNKAGLYANTAARMRVYLYNYDTFEFYIRSYGENNWDYVIVSRIDDDSLTYSSSYTSSNVYAHTRGKATNVKTLDGYTKVTFTNCQGDRFFDILYRKDSSGSQNDDRGYVLLPQY